MEDVDGLKETNCYVGEVCTISEHQLCGHCHNKLLAPSLANLSAILFPAQSP